MRGKNAKLIRKVAKETAKSNGIPLETKWKIRRHDDAIIVDLCLRQTYQWLKKEFKAGNLTTEDFQAALKG